MHETIERIVFQFAERKKAAAIGSRDIDAVAATEWNIQQPPGGMMTLYDM